MAEEPTAARCSCRAADAASSSSECRWSRRSSARKSISRPSTRREHTGGGGGTEKCARHRDAEVATASAPRPGARGSCRRSRRRDSAASTPCLQTASTPCPVDVHRDVPRPVADAEHEQHESELGTTDWTSEAPTQREESTARSLRRPPSDSRNAGPACRSFGVARGSSRRRGSRVEPDPATPRISMQPGADLRQPRHPAGLQTSPDSAKTSPVAMAERRSTRYGAAARVIVGTRTACQTPRRRAASAWSEGQRRRRPGSVSDGGS